MRKGSIVTLILGELNGPGSQNTSITGATVLDVRQEYLEVDNSGAQVVLPWHSIRQAIVTTP